MYTAHSKQSLLCAHKRLADIFEKAGEMLPIYNFDDKIVEECHTYRMEIEVLKCENITHIRNWAKQCQLTTVYPSKKIMIAVNFLATAFEKVGSFDVKTSIEYTEHGEYANNDTKLKIRTGKYPIIRCKRYGSDPDDATYILVNVDGINYYGNKSYKINNERRMVKENIFCMPTYYGLEFEK